MIDSAFKKFPSSLPIFFLVLMILVPFWKLATMQGYVITDDIFTSDIMNEGFPYRHYISEALKNGELPTWLPYIYGGMPLLARAEAGACYPPNLILFGLLPPYVALNIVILLTLITAAVTMYFYARELDATIAGAVIAGLAFAYSGFMVSHIKHLSMIGTVCWFPLGLLVIERSLKRSSPRTLLWLSLVFGTQNLSGHIQTAYYAGLVYGVYFIFRLLALRKSDAPRKRKQKFAEPTGIEHTMLRRLIFSFFIATVLAVGISAVQLLPTYELVGLTQRSGGVTFEYAASYAYDPANLKTFFYPFANGDISDASYRGESVFWEDYGYVGLITLLLALYAVVKGWRSWHVRFCFVVALLAYVLVLGPNTPLYELAFNIVPGMKFFRFPTRFLFVVNGLLCVLAALGASRIKSGKKIAFGASGIELALLAAVIADLLFFQLRQNPIVNAREWHKEPRTVTTVQRDSTLYRIFSPGASETHKAAFADARGWSGTLQPYLDQREFVQPSSNVLYGISSADGYAQLTPNYVVDIWGDQNRSGLILTTASLSPDGRFLPQESFLKIMNLFNVKYIVSPWSVASGKLEFVEQNGGAFVYRNPEVLPRAFLVHNFRLASDIESAKTMLVSDYFDPAREAILYEQPVIANGRDGDSSVVTIERYATNEVVVRVSSASGGILVLSDTFYPGWNVSVDGKETKILQANICQRGVVVDGGNRTVRFRFESASILWGSLVSLCSLIAMSVGVIVRPKGKA